MNWVEVEENNHQLVYGTVHRAKIGKDYPESKYYSVEIFLNSECSVHDATEFRVPMTKPVEAIKAAVELILRLTGSIERDDDAD